MSDLNDKQRRFVDEYLVDLNATQAAIRAGYSERTAYSQGHDLLKKPEIAAAVQESQSKRAERTELSADWVVTRLVENVDRAMQAVAVKDREGHETGEYQYEGSVANRALELLGKHVGMFRDKVEVTGADGGAIENSITVTFVRPKAEQPKPE